MTRRSRIRKLNRALFIAAATCVTNCCTSLVATSATLEWARQLGTAVLDYGDSVSADGLGNVYISGGTTGSLGATNPGEIYAVTDPWVAKYGAAGDLQWIRQLVGPPLGHEYNNYVSADALGNVYIAGRTDTSLGGSTAGGFDAWVAKYDSAGGLQWTRQLGTSGTDNAFGVSADGLGNVYITGITQGSLGGPNAGDRDPYVAKYDTTGSLLWVRQLGTSAWDYSRSVSADRSGNVYITGETQGSLGGPHAGGAYDAWVARYDAAGNHIWTRQLGTTASESARDVSADGLGNVYITGYTDGSLGGPSAGLRDAFMAKYNDSGMLQWTRQLGTASNDWSGDVSADGLGNVYISGYTGGSLGGPSAGGDDAFVAKYNAAGELVWTHQLGTGNGDLSSAVSADGLGNVYIGGRTQGSLGGPFAGGPYDSWLAKFVDSSVASLPGDFNRDGTVDAADYITWRNGLGSEYTQDHYAQWRANFGTTAAGAAAGAPADLFNSTNPAIPEPNSLALTIALLVLGLPIIRRRSRFPPNTQLGDEHETMNA